MSVQKWANLRTSLPRGISIKKVIALVNASIKLHNFCIDQTDLSRVGGGDEGTRESSADDMFNLMNDANRFVALDDEME
jgi:hypothetical protein